MPVSEVVIAGVGGSDATALLVLREPQGAPLTAVAPGRITDAVLDDVWRNIARLHDMRIAHGGLRAANVLLRPDGSTAFVDFALASSGAPAERSLLDAVEFLVTSAALVGEDRALAAADRALGHRGLADVLPMLEPAALTWAARHDVADTKGLLKRLRERGEELTGEEVAAPVELRRIAPTDILLAAGAILGVYLLIGELAGIDWATTFNNPEWGWIAIAFLLSWTTPFSSAIAMMGSVAIPLPYKAVVGEQFANNFTGLVGGTVATTALVIRFFQKQGQKVAVAASSGVLNSLASMVVQAILVVTALVFTSSDFTPVRQRRRQGHRGFRDHPHRRRRDRPRRRARRAEAPAPACRAWSRRSWARRRRTSRGSSRRRARPRCCSAATSSRRCCSRWCSKPRCTRTASRCRCSRSS